MKTHIAALISALLFLPGALRAQEGGQTPSTDQPEAGAEATDQPEGATPESKPAEESSDSPAADKPAESSPPESGPDETAGDVSASRANEPPAAGDEGDLDEDDLGAEPAFTPTKAFKTDIYGYVDSQWRTLAFTNGLPPPKEKMFPKVFRKFRGGGWLNLNVMLQGDVFERYHWFINLGALKAADINDGDVALDIRNAWVEVPLWKERLLLRAGKTYRRFGLYNEILDAAPTFPGVEVPAYLVGGQTFLTRTTNLMLHGTWLFGEDRLQYTLEGGTDERKGGTLPFGGDLRYHIGEDLVFGGSAYYSTESQRTRGVGQGEPIGGVKNWMAKDTFYVWGGFAQLNKGPLLLQAEYWKAHHDARRDPSSVIQLSMVAELNMRRRQRMFGGVDMPTESDVIVPVQYDTETAYLRFGYELPVGEGSIMPYLHLDYYSDPETIPGFPLGGNEAGIADDGVFYRTVLGAVYRPVPAVAFKAEVNPHYLKVAGKNAIFFPLQASISYFWNLDQL